MIDSICIIIVLYNQNLNIKKVSNSKYRYIVIDNTPERNLALSLNNVTYIPLKENKGIAYAQNVGIQTAIALNYQYIVFFDQDTIIEDKYINDIFSEFNRLKLKYKNIACVGPLIINKKNGKYYKSKTFNIEDKEIITDSIISSGSLIPISAINEIGMMKAELFIDYVDFEWCWRAKSKSYNIIQSTQLTILHEVGNKYINILGIKFIISAPIRYYYQYRNLIWLSKLDYIPKGWLLKNYFRKFTEPMISIWLMRNKKEYITSIYNGLTDGIKLLRNQ